MRRLISTLLLAGLVSLPLYPPAGPMRPAAAAETAAETPGGEVMRLIEELGSPSYATRLRAREKLQRLGLEAFDALHEAQYSADTEIAMAARHLIGSLSVSWSRESDPREVRDALREYGAQSLSERESRIQMLGELPQRMGLPALARLVRFEPDLRLSEKAALVLMQQAASDEPERRRQRSEVLLATIDSSDRTACRWLRAYAKDLATGEFSFGTWRRLIAEQRRAVDAAATDIASTSSVLELVRVCVSRGARAGNRDEALALAADHIDLIPPKSRHLIDACSWALDNGLHSFVLELKSRHEQLFADHPVLLYGAAEALFRLDQTEAAGEMAEAAAAIDPVPADPGERDQLSPKRIQELAETHLALGQDLRDRGLFRWAEREYRHIIERLPVDSRAAAFARRNLALMFGELQRHGEVVAVLTPLIDRIEKDKQLMRRLNGVRFDYSWIRSLQQFHEGLGLIERGRREAAAPVLEKAWDLSNPPNVDILIAMYRLDLDAQWNRRVRDILDKTIAVAETDIRNAEIQARQMGRFGFSDERLASELNEYAWLVSNTEGDYRKALRYSERSLEISPDEPALLDTCARCHFALGDYVAAIQTQRRALRLMPHSPPLRRQLRQFEAAAEEAGALSDSESP